MPKYASQLINLLIANRKIVKENGEYKTGLYVKDTIRGVATLTYIDKQDETVKFGALGHEIAFWRSSDNTR